MKKDNYVFSVDEEDGACAFECYQNGTKDLDKLKRAKVIRSVQHNNKLK